MLCVRSGNQNVVDGALVGDGVLEMDESLLTSESMGASPIQLCQG
jgi:hypothetical protein